MESFALLRVYVDYVRTSQEAHPWAFTVCYGDSFTFLYADDFRKSQETQGLHGLLREQLYFFYVDDVCKSQETYLWASSRPRRRNSRIHHCETCYLTLKSSSASRQ
jgi:hypothetical protein